MDQITTNTDKFDDEMIRKLAREVYRLLNEEARIEKQRRCLPGNWTRRRTGGR